MVKAQTLIIFKSLGLIIIKISLKITIINRNFTFDFTIDISSSKVNAKILINNFIFVGFKTCKVKQKTFFSNGELKGYSKAKNEAGMRLL